MLDCQVVVLVLAMACVRAYRILDCVFVCNMLDSPDTMLDCQVCLCICLLLSHSASLNAHDYCSFGVALASF